MKYNIEALTKHREWKGKIRIVSVPLECKDDLKTAYTPGVAAPCLEINKNPDLSFELTRRWNTVAVVTDGTAVLGLGDIGPEAGMPVMEGKCALFSRFGGIDAIPLCLRTKSTEEIVRTVELLAGSFGGINLEDISAPRCFEIEKLLQERCDIPIFHDDQHGTAVVAGAALTNAMRLLRKNKPRIIINGAGAAGVAIAKALLMSDAGEIIVCDRSGIICGEEHYDNPAKAEIAAITNPSRIKGGLKEAMRGADVFIGVSAAGCVSREMVASMNKNPVIFALANPTPEIMPDDALCAGAAIVATGRSDFPNQINNVLAFPGIFRGALDARARVINGEMKLAASRAIADSVPDDRLAPDFIIPDVFDEQVHSRVAAAVASAAWASGVARVEKMLEKNC